MAKAKKKVWTNAEILAASQKAKANKAKNETGVATGSATQLTKNYTNFFDIAQDLYGDQRMAEALMAANPGVRFFSAGMTLKTPPQQTGQFHVSPEFMAMARGQFDYETGKPTAQYEIDQASIGTENVAAASPWIQPELAAEIDPASLALRGDFTDIETTYNILNNITAPATATPPSVRKEVAAQTKPTPLTPPGQARSMTFIPGTSVPVFPSQPAPLTTLPATAMEGRGRAEAARAGSTLLSGPKDTSFGVDWVETIPTRPPPGKVLFTGEFLPEEARITPDAGTQTTIPPFGAYKQVERNKPEGAIIVLGEDGFYYRFNTGPDVKASEIIKEPVTSLERYLATDNPDMATAAEIAIREKEYYAQLVSSPRIPQQGELSAAQQTATQQTAAQRPPTTTPSTGGPFEKTELLVLQNPKLLPSVLEEVAVRYIAQHPEIENALLTDNVDMLTDEQLALLSYLGLYQPPDQSGVAPRRTIAAPPPAN